MEGRDPWVGTWRPHQRKGPIAALYGSPGPKHGLPTLTGSSNHDPTKRKAPAYSLGSRSRHGNSQCSPGPKYLLPSKVTRTGHDHSPAYSLSRRWEKQTVQTGPGPGHYAPEKGLKAVFPSTPAFSLSGRENRLSTKKTPGPADYNLPSLLGSRNATKRSSQAVTIKGRNKHGSFYEDLRQTPGPAAYKVVDSSKVGTKPPQFSIGYRRSYLRDTTMKPGPGAHYPERVTITKKGAPSISFGVRHSQYIAPLVQPDN